MGTGDCSVPIHGVYKIHALLAVVQDLQIEIQAGLSQGFPNQHDVGFGIFDQDNMKTGTAHAHPACIWMTMMRLSFGAAGGSRPRVHCRILISLGKFGKPLVESSKANP